MFRSLLNLKSAAKDKTAMHLPKSIYVDYRVGLEKAVLEEVKAEISRVVKELEWPKAGVSFSILKIENHPALEPGYAFEILLHGDGVSYLDGVIETFKSPNQKLTWIELTKGNWAFIEFRAGGIETSWSSLSPNNKDHVSDWQSRSGKKTKPYFVESYMFFYVSLWLLILSVLSMPTAAIFKYVWYDKEKTFINKQYYTPNIYMPIESVMRLGSTRNINSRPLAVHYTPQKSWYVIFEKKEDDGSVSFSERKIGKDGNFTETTNQGK